MIPKERKVVVAVLAATVVVLLVGFLAYFFIIGPIGEKNKLIADRNNEIDDLDLKKARIELEKKKFEAQRQQSLPKDVGLARGQYAALLDSLARKADFAPGSFKITSKDPDAKSAPKITAKEVAYVKLNYEITVRSDLYRITDFLTRFYQQPLLHTIEKLNLLRPNDVKAQTNKELDATFTIEAIILDTAPDRPNLIPIGVQSAIVSGAAIQTAYNRAAVATGAGSATMSDIASRSREYLAIAGKNIFYGPLPEKTERAAPESPPEPDESYFITLTSIVQYEDGKLVAVFRDKATNNDYTAEQSPSGEISVKGEYTLNGKRRLITGYSERVASKDIAFGSEEGKNRRFWRVRRILVDAVVLERIDLPKTDEKPKPVPLTFAIGGTAAFAGITEGKMYRATVGQSLIPTVGEAPKEIALVTKYLLTREAAKDIYSGVDLQKGKESAKPAASAVSTDRGR